MSSPIKARPHSLDFRGLVRSSVWPSSLKKYDFELCKLLMVYNYKPILINEV